MFRAIGRFCSAYPRLVLLLWILMFALALPLAGRVGEVLTPDAGIAPESEAQRVEGTVADSFEAQRSQVLLVARSNVEDGAAGDAEDERAAQSRALEDALDSVAALPGVKVTDSRSSGAFPIPTLEDAGASVALLDLSGSQANLGHVAARLPEVAGLEVYLTANSTVEHEIREISERDALRAERYGLPLSLAVLAVAFGALVAASLPLVVALFSVTLSFAFLFLLGQFFTFATFAQIIVTMLGLATGIDYALLIVNRFREELGRSETAKDAAIFTTETAGKAVAFSGLTVLIALSALLVPPLPFVRSMGVASITVILFSMVVSVTALPAALTLLGARVNALRLTRVSPGVRSRAFWEAQARRVTHRPLLWSVLGVAALLLISLPAKEMQLGFSGVRGLTQNTDTRKAHEILDTLGFSSLLRSFDVLIDFGETGFYHPESVRGTSKLTRQALALDDVDKVYSPTTAGSFPALLLNSYYATQATALASPARDLVNATVSQDGRYALVRVFPPSGIAPAESNRLADTLRLSAYELGLDVSVGGPYVTQREWTRTLYRTFPWALSLVYLATFVLLGLAFRSLLIPIKSIALNTLTVGAAFGAITLVFQFGWGGSLLGLGGALGFVESSVPIFIFAVVFGLSMDYEVFLVSRIAENHRRGLSDKDAVVRAVGTTGGVITSAALIMGVVFSVFLFSGVVFIKTLSLGLLIAVLLDATLVRLVLVPAVTLLAGRWNWWLPRPLARLAERIDLSHDAPERGALGPDSLGPESLSHD